MTIKKKSTQVTAKPAAAAKKTAPVVSTPKAEGPRPADVQLAAFQEGVRLFTAKNFKDALAAFAKVPPGPASNIADKAKSYSQICERQVARPAMDLKTAEDHFNYGVERLNARDIEQARYHFGRALALQPNADHILYTFAITCGLDGDASAACENLRRAIEIEPRNRILARQDPDFTALAHQHPALRTLLDSSAG